MQRIQILFAVIALLYIGIVARLFHWQILQGDGLRVSAAAQHAQHLRLMPDRGEILTSDGASLVVNQPAYFLYAEPNLIENKLEAANHLAPIVQKDSQELFSQFSDPNKKWVPLMKRASKEIKEQVAELNIFGVAYESQSMRYYPEASMAAHLLGFVGSDDQGNDKGYFGLEGYYDRELAGKEGSVLMEQDAKGSEILIGDATRLEPENGRSLVLWLNRSMQYIVQSRLKEGIRKYGAKEGNVVVMDPKTGGILAMASYPDYNPGEYQFVDKELYTNPVVADGYEPGSTFKPLIMAAAINEGLVNGSSTFVEGGPVQIGEYSIRTWNDEYHGTISMTQVLQYSSNVGMVYVSRQLGNERMLSYIEGYGFGKETGIDLEDESSPALRERTLWTEIDYATSSFGQGIAVTPLQLVRAIGAIANDGWLMKPQVVKEFHDAKGNVVKMKQEQIRQVISSNAARHITDMMVTSAKYGEAKWAAPKGYKVAGKTGTAQIPVAGHYEEEKTIASFVGFAPADDPKFVMLVVLTEPKTSQWGSETAAPLFFVIAKELFTYMGIPPSSSL